MKNIISREKLIEAQKSFECDTWVKTTQELLNNNLEDELEISQEIIDLILNKCTWKQIQYILEQNIDLGFKINEEAKAFVLEQINSYSQEIIKNESRDLIFFKKEDKILFLLDHKNKEFWFEYNEIYEVLETKYSHNYNEMRYLMDSILFDLYKVKGYTPKGQHPLRT